MHVQGACARWSQHRVRANIIRAHAGCLRSDVRVYRSCGRATAHAPRHSRPSACICACPRTPGAGRHSQPGASLTLSCVLAKEACHVRPTNQREAVAKRLRWRRVFFTCTTFHMDVLALAPTACSVSRVARPAGSARPSTSTTASTASSVTASTVIDGSERKAKSLIRPTQWNEDVEEGASQRNICINYIDLMCNFYHSLPLPACGLSRCARVFSSSWHQAR
jgi:hypothetical protein